VYEYKFAECAARFERGAASVAPVREVVERHARDGWRLVQVLVTNPAAVPTRYEVIFERPAAVGVQS
jgi:hypothetical protein